MKTDEQIFLKVRERVPKQNMRFVLCARLEVTQKMESYTKQYWEVLSASFAASKHIQCKECKGVIRGLRVKSHLCAKVCVCENLVVCEGVCVRVCACVCLCVEAFLRKSVCV